ncbi:Z1 domain-containing protein [Demequina zhanjiangensis]|uniref:Z1 domain-containing protein n=1 Tax=Demequina zhanjiangensis TaxID=3051659 RepID=A0ABT8G2M6_9MICO|nr:Z1 domain-containing protein [Demequina sp. SYSU T00b26]MDN4473375.1 Z1 domain-containing protein [Demequina sp. SYSU T00b26]
MSETSRGVIDADADYIVHKGVLGAGPAGDRRWPASRQRNGVVMGAVQSGKTASMMAVAAKLLDAEVDGVVILAGTRRALWLQTLERLAAQLDTLESPLQRRELIPSVRAVETEGFSGGPSALYSMTPQKAKRLVQKRRPLIAVVMKNTTHLEHMGRTLRDVLYPAAAEAARPFHLVVIDDEADDSSIGEGSSAFLDIDGSSHEKQVPLRITDLWRGRNSPGGTVNEHVYATYLAYTATPQANFLQDASNPLAPRDFVVSLRTPGAEGMTKPRSSSYRVPEGLKAWYTGGDVYYEKLAAIPLCRAIDPTETSEEEQIADAMRAYLVASAIRLLRSEGRLGPFSARGHVFESRAEAKVSTVPPMSMLVHPSAAMNGHFDAAARILQWSRTGEAGPGPIPDAGERSLEVEGIRIDMEQRPERWLAWLEEYRRASLVVADVGELSDPPFVPDDGLWPEVRSLVLEELVPGTNVAVINSDPDADDRPRYDPVRGEDGWCAAPNLSTVFVSGTVMSRGLTLEGLTTTLFTRTSNAPLADTQMQMQRWFGYRGSYIELCRVFASDAQVELFRSYHVNDEALRREILAAMEAEEGSVPDIAVLQGHSFKATGKVPNVQGHRLNPGPRPFVRYMNPEGRDDENLRLVADLFSDHVVPVPAPDGRQGMLLEHTFSAVEVAELLESLRYQHLGRGSDGPGSSRWKSAARQAGIADDDPIQPLYRAPAVAGAIAPQSVSPYDLAAYLRFWDAVATRDVSSLVAVGARPTPWNLLSHSARERNVPRFHIGLRFGSGEPIREGPLALLPVEARPMQREVKELTDASGVNVGGELVATWGARNITDTGIFGDEFFDIRAQGRQPTEEDLDGRAPGADGLVLFHLVGRVGGGQSIAVGLSIPSGGPDHVEARVGR